MAELELQKPVGLKAEIDALEARSSHSITTPVDREGLLRVRLSHHVVERAQLVPLPPTTLIVPDAGRLDLSNRSFYPLLDGRLQESLLPTRTENALRSPLHCPDLIIARLNDVFYLPHGVLIMPEERTFVSDYVHRAAAYFQPWMTYHGENMYTINVDVPDQPVLQGKFLYLDHAVLHHFGHFIVDCLSRLWAWDFLKEMAGFHDLKLVVSHMIEPFAEEMLTGFGIAESDLVKLAEPVVFEDLYLSTPGFLCQNYTSPAANHVWRKIRDSLALPGDYPSRIYISRSNVESRQLVNESAVEHLFAAYGFTIIHPQDIPVAGQVSLFANAELIAGPGGSGLYNLAFQEKLRSVFILVSDTFVQNAELMLCAFHDVSVHCFFGSPAPLDPDNPDPSSFAPWVVDENRLARAVTDWLASV
jgi:capsular polysaccharide biosynthesis protein